MAALLRNGDPVMNRRRKQAARIAVFLECAGLDPIVRGSTYQEYCTSLAEQYCRLETPLRRRARIEGRRRIRKEGIESAAVRLIPVPASACDLTKLTPQQRRRVGSRYRRTVRQRSPETPLCPKCRIAPGLPKRSWPTREMAEEAKSRQRDPRLHVYPCPAQPGFWHLGHRRRRPSLSASSSEPAGSPFTLRKKFS